MVERSPLRVDQATFAKVVHVLQLVTVEATGDVDALVGMRIGTL